MTAHQRENILGVRIDPLNMDSTIEHFQRWIKNRTPAYICVTPAHGVMDGYNDPEIKKILNQSGLTTPDGMAIVWILKLSGHKNVSRVYGPDIMLAACEAGLEKSWRHFFYGGNPGVAEALTERLKARHPGLIVAGTYCPPFRPLTLEEEKQVEKEIRAAQPDIIWVGLSTPKQERWMAKFVDRLDVPVLVGVGAAFDFLSGNKKQAPQWVQRIGMEWFFRLSHEPRRLWRRYLQYPKFVFLVMAQWLGIKKFDNGEG